MNHLKQSLIRVFCPLFYICLILFIWFNYQNDDIEIMSQVLSAVNILPSYYYESASICIFYVIKC